MTNLCENCTNLPAIKKMQGSAGVTCHVCNICAGVLVFYGFKEIPSAPTTVKEIVAKHKGYTADCFGNPVNTTRPKECECGNSDKPMNSQLHSHWCPGYKQEFL